MNTTLLLLLVFGMFMLFVEKTHPGRIWKKVDGWLFRSIVLNIIQVSIVYLSSYSWSVWFQDIPVFRIENSFGMVGSAFAGYFLITFVFYWWHRARHEVPFLWCKLHQIHHSAQRLEALTAFYKHPAEIFINSVFMSFIMYSLLGLSPAAASFTTMLTGIGELFYHWNIKTPKWVGYIFQRPESHCIHHKRGWHTQNYSDLPLWDMIFGTFRNPDSFDGECGFSDDKERLLKDMLLGTDVNPPKIR